MSGPLAIFICSGNTCRSPLAEAVAGMLFPNWTFRSAGVGAVAGCPASAGTCDMARDRRLDLNGHRSQRLDAELASTAAWLIGMTADHVSAIHAALPGYLGKVGKLGCPGVVLGSCDDPVPGEDVDDPWRQGTELAYELMAEQVERLLAAWAHVFMEAPR